MVTIKELLEWMVAQGASDLFLTAGSAPMCRVNSDLQAFGPQPLSSLEIDSLLDSVMSRQQREEFQHHHEMNLGFADKGLGRFRFNMYRQQGCPAAVVRRISSDIPSIEVLGLPPQLKEVALLKRGLVLVVGATGSGKSTTLASIIDHRNTSAPGHIVTVEDPIEFVHEHKRSLVSQREVGIDTASFHAALKNSLRQAPDVILIGEVRDTETMEAAVSFAETGHLCLATLHSNNASQAIERVMNFFPPQRHQQIYMQLSLNLRAIVGQRLIPSVAGSRVAAVELLLDTPRIRDLIMKGQIAELREAMEKSGNYGVQTFDQHLFALVKSGAISQEQAVAHADSPNNLRLRFSLEKEAANDTSSTTAEEPPLKMMQ
jgi:twitching motility protein PilU